jgi:hypothetical protein
LEEKMRKPTKLSPSESVYGVLEWLLSRNTETKFGVTENAAPAVELAKSFCESNDLGEPRPDFYKWTKNPD